MRATLFAFVGTLAFVTGASLAWQWWGDRTQGLGSNEEPASTTHQGAQQPALTVQHENRPGIPKHDPFTTSDQSDRIAESAAQQTDADSRLTNLEHRTSWQDPFDKSFWKQVSGDVKFDDGLQLGSQSSLTFGRTYSQVMLEFYLQSTAGHRLDQKSFELSIDFRTEKRNGIQIRFADQQCGIIATAPGSQPRTVKSRRVSFDSKSKHIRISLTPNRILVGWDGRMVMNATRQSSLVNSELGLDISRTDDHSSYIVLRKMRIEGE